MPIVLRLIKGAELTFAELDGNFTDLDNRLDTIEGFNLNQRVTRLEAAGTPIYFDSDDVMVMLDSIWANGQDSFLATVDSVGLASFNTNHFLVDSGRASIRLATNDSVGISSFDSEDFVVTNGHITLLNAGASLDSTGVASFDSANFVVTDGHVTINPNSAAGRVAGITPIDSTGVASFAGAEFNVSSDGHVTHNTTFLDSAVRTRVSATDAGGFGSFAYNSSTGVFTYTGPSASDIRGNFSGGTGISISGSGVISSTVSVSTTAGAVGTYCFAKSPSSKAFGGTIAGSSLQPSNADGLGNGSLSGTWRCMGVAQTGSVRSETTLFVRIS